MNVTQQIMKSYGESIGINGFAAFGFITSLDADNCAIHALPLPPGRVNGAKYGLFTCDEIHEGDTVTHDGRSFVVLRVEPVYIFGERSHNECVLTPKGGCSDDKSD